jgi:apolipoprotein N-acyltransferase
MRLQESSVAVPGVVLRIVQPNIAQDEKWRAANARSNFDQLKALSSQPGLDRVTHLIWPESAVSFLIDESAVAKAELRPLLAGRTVLITGAIRRAAPSDDADSYNSIIIFDGQTNVAARYDKWRLVPGGEFLPFAGLLEPLGFRKVVTVPGNFTAGQGPITLGLPAGPPAGFLVCYEVIFPHGLVDSEQRPRWLINVTNDGWFGESTGPAQHLAQARLRAIEQGLPVVRAANTGISAIIDPFGRYQARSQLGSESVLDGRLPQALSLTFYARFGDFALAFLTLVAASLAFIIQRCNYLK